MSAFVYNYQGREAAPTLTPASLRGRLHTPEGQAYLRSTGINPDDYDWDAYKKMHQEKEYQAQWGKQAELNNMNSFDKGFLKRASEAGVHPKAAQEALEYIKQASPITGKAAPANNQTIGDSASQKSLQAPATPAAAQQRMAMPRLQIAQQLQPRIAPQLQPQLAPQVSQMQGPPMPQPMPQPQLAQQVQPKLAPQMQPKLAPQMVPGPLRPPMMPQMNQPMLAPRR